MNIDVKNHMSTMDEEIAKKVLEMLTKGEKSLLMKLPACGREKGSGRSSKGSGCRAGSCQKRKRKRNPRVGRKARRSARLSKEKKEKPQESLALEGRVTVGEVAGRLNVMPSEILGKLLDLGIICNINQQLNDDVLEILSEEYGIKFDVTPDPDEEL